VSEHSGPAEVLSIPALSLVVLVGPSGSGKSTFARAHFAPTEVISSDFCRGLVSDDENDQSATPDAFDVLQYVVAKRLARGLLTVVDATNVQPESRKPLVELARRFHMFPVAIVLDVPPSTCHERNRTRENRSFGFHVVRQQASQLRRSIRGLAREGFRFVHTLSHPAEITGARIDRTPSWSDRRGDRGPFDFVGDVHGCADELEELLTVLGYVCDSRGVHRHPAGRTLVFVGDLVDRGPRIADVLRIAIDMVEAGSALCVPGNHDVKLRKWLQGRDVRIAHGLQASIDALETAGPEFRARVLAFLDGLISHYVLDGGEVVVAHAGMKAEMQGRGSGKVRDFALYGETTGETDDLGLPVRHDWAAKYRGRARVVYGHTPVASPEWVNRTINLDTGCVFGGRLTALRYPEEELVSVPARREYVAPIRPIPAPPATGLSTQHTLDQVLDLADVSGKRIVTTRLARTVTIREENGLAAIEVMSRFAADPRWLVYLPPTMSPTETSERAELLEHPAEAFAYYRSAGVDRVVCEEKHMGSRAVVVVCRDEEVARRRFGAVDDGAGVVYTRTGRRFFADRALEDALLEHVRAAIGRAGLWSELATDWVCLDCELMPWSAKAQELIRRQYAAVGASATAALAATLPVLDCARSRGVEVTDLHERACVRAELIGRYVGAYGHYCWPVASLADLELAPFHVLATESAVHVDNDHAWHLDVIARLCGAADGVLLATAHREVDLASSSDEARATAWWEELTSAGGEGMVVKPRDFVVTRGGRLVQPAIKCRGREYLRIIYGPDYTLPEHLCRLRRRGVSTKRSLALREFALGIEGLERFVRREPLRRVHECALGVLALESEPVDPRL